MPTRDPIAAIEAALRQHPRNPQLSDTEYDTHLKSALGIFQNIREQRRATPNRHRHLGPRVARRDLERLAASLEASADVRAAMHAEAHVALADANLATLEGHLRAVAGRVRRIDVSEVPLRPKKRERQHPEVMVIANHAATFFWLLTGKEPTRITLKTAEGDAIGVGGPFVALLTALFEALDVSASVEGTAKRIVAALHRARKNQQADEQAARERERESMEYIRAVEREQAQSDLNNGGG